MCLLKAMFHKKSMEQTLDYPISQFYFKNIFHNNCNLVHIIKPRLLTTYIFNLQVWKNMKKIPKNLAMTTGCVSPDTLEYLEAILAK